MKRASISDAKNNLSALLDRVRHGQTIVIEDRGVPVARLEPIVGDGREPDGRLARLERHGIVRRPSQPLPPSFISGPLPRALKRRSASEEPFDERRPRR